MPDKTYNCISRSGASIRNPYYLYSLELNGERSTGNGEFPLGDFSSRYSVQELIGYLAMRGFGVTIAEQAKWIEEHKPILHVTITEHAFEQPHEPVINRFDHTGQKLTPAGAM